MARVTCKHHPQRGARWFCGNCLINFCARCVSRDTVGEQPVCPLCRAPVTDIGTERLIPAFWNRLPRFFAYPFQPRALALIVLFVLASALIGYQSLPGWVLQSVLFLLFTKFAYAVLTHSSEGHTEPPPLSAVFTRGFGPALKQYPVFLLLGIPVIPASLYGGEFGAVVGSLFFMGIMPAAMMVLATSESVAAAISPDRLFGTVRGIGWAYLGLFGVLTVLSGGSAAFQEWLMGRLLGDLGVLMEQIQIAPDGVDPAAIEAAREAFVARLFSWGLPLLISVHGYFTLVSFALMGYVLYQYHDRLGLPVAVAVDEDTETGRNEHPLLGDVDVLIREGRYDQAAQTLRERVIRNRDDMKLRERFHRLLVLLGDTRRACGHGAEYMGMLLRSQNPAKAAAVYRDCRALDSAFAPESAGETLPLAQVLFHAGDHEGVVGLSNGFHRTHAGHPDIPALYFLTARSLSEGLGRDHQARPILQSLLRNYASHPLAPQMQRYLDALDRMAAATV